MHEQRIQQLSDYLSKQQLDAFLVSKPTSLQYLLGFTGSNGLCLFSDKTVFFLTDFRYKEQAAAEVTTAEIVPADGPLFDSLNKLPGFDNIKRLGFESEYVTFNTHQKLCGIAGDAALIPCSEAIDGIAARKSPEEITLIQKACDITVSVYNDIQPLFREGVSEIEIAAEISYKIKRQGGDGDAFEPHVLFGKNSAFPHGKPGQTKLRMGDVIQLDFGAAYKGYNSDFSRVLFMGSPPEELLNIHNVVKKALEQAIEMIEPGKPANEIDAAARNIINQGGFAQYFGHSVGHGVGLTVHSLPKISAANTEPLEEGNVFTVEPGIYIPDFGGIRIEDVVSIEQSGIKVLTNVRRELALL